MVKVKSEDFDLRKYKYNRNSAYVDFPSRKIIRLLIIAGLRFFKYSHCVSSSEDSINLNVAENVFFERFLWNHEVDLKCLI